MKHLWNRVFAKIVNGFYLFFIVFIYYLALLREKCLNTDFFSGPNTGKYGPEKTQYLGTFYAMFVIIFEKKSIADACHGSK